MVTDLIADIINSFIQTRIDQLKTAVFTPPNIIEFRHQGGSNS